MKRAGKLILCGIAALTLTACTARSNRYPHTAVVVEVDYNADEVVLEDFAGERWSFCGTEDWMEGDIASLLMDDHGTESIYDDEIVSARYSGWIEQA